MTTKRKSQQWLEVEDTDFVHHVIASSSILLAPEEAANPEYMNGEKLHPAKEYAIEVSGRLIPLVERIYSLNEIFALLEVRSFPIKLDGAALSRFELLRIVIDLIHVRFSSIRDSAVLITAGVLEIKRPPQALKISLFENESRTKKIATALKRLGLIGQDIRQARNLNFHQSYLLFPALDDYEQNVFRAMSKFEGGLHPSSEKDLLDMHFRAVSRMRKDFEAEAKKIVRQLKLLFGHLDKIYIEKLDLKFGRVRA